MSSISATQPGQGAQAVHAHENQISTGSVMTTAQNRNITTAPTGVQSEIDNNTFHHITVNGGTCNWFQSTHQHVENSSDQDMKDGRRLSSGPSPQRPNFSIAELMASTSPSASALLSPCVTTEPQSPTQDACVPLPRLESWSLEKYGQHHEKLSVRVEVAYDAVLNLLDSKRFLSSKRTKERLQFDIKVQKASYLKTVTSLVEVLVSPLPETTSSQDANIEVCTQIDDSLDRLWSQLHRLAGDIARFDLKHEGRPLHPEISRKTLTDGFRVLEIDLDRFSDAALQLIQEFSPPDLSSRTSNACHNDLELKELEKLSTEGRISAMLYQCLCRACPEQCHTRHTAYLSLEPEETDTCASPDSLGTTRIMWQCHMAFKSTAKKKVPLIWFRVVSSEVSDSGHQELAIVGEQTTPECVTDHQQLNEAAENNPRKRRTASTPTEPPSKVAKSRPGQSIRRVSEPAASASSEPPSQLSVCPELLAQHDLDTVVMKMIDDGGYSHDIFYLPRDKRPIHDTKLSDPVSLSDILGKGQLKHQYDKLCSKRLSIIRVSRLIAEAVLRFDLRDRDPSPEDSVVFYISPENDLAPFLERVITKSKMPSVAVEDEDSASQRRSLQLLKLGEILLQLGLPKSHRMRSPPLEPKGRRMFIKSAVSNVRANMDTIFSDVIISCVNFSARYEETNKLCEESFNKRFYRNIVQPLKNIERGLLLRQV
ncbi:hypothetical protein CSUB01_06345 [Colletotrichum sublineola]|uniref:Uncharacterized protein n=1 Tax=Colletotrichum sublineola TaxID=1173701 RepID=A0A066WXD5_COLSU|nr:hypothetical protein CSUB01_06345 [Colletotrichum sublineola]